MRTPSFAQLAAHLRFAPPPHAEALLARATVLGAAFSATTLVVLLRLGRAPGLSLDAALACAGAALLLAQPERSLKSLLLAFSAAAAGWLLFAGPERYLAWAAAFVAVLPGELPERLLRLAGAVGGALWYRLVLGWIPRMTGPLPVGLAVVLALSSALFVALGTLAVYLRVRGDAVDARLADLGETAARTRERWQRVQRQVGRLDVGAQQRRARALAEGTVQRALEALGELERLDACLAGPEQGEARAELERLDGLVSQQADATTRAHLAQARQLHSDTLEQLDGLSRRRERLAAKLESESAVLEKLARTLELCPASSAARDEALGRVEALVTPAAA